MSLRDQLLKKGLASKQQAKKAAKAAKKKEHQQNTAKKLPASEVPPDEIKLQIAKDLDARKEKDRLLNQENLRSQQRLKAVQIVFSFGELESAGARIPYFFKRDDNAIESVYVNKKQQSLLSEGKLGIATLLDDRYYLLDKDNCLQLKLLRPELLVCFHQ